MKQDIPPTRTSTTTTPSRFRATPRPNKDQTSNRVSPVLKSRPRSVPPDPNNALKVRRSLGLNKLKSSEDGGVMGSQRTSRETSNTTTSTTSRQQVVVEQFARPRQRLDPSFRRVEEDSEGKRKELQEKLSVSENLVKNLQDEVLGLKAQVENLQSLNVQLELQNKRFAQDLADAQAKISILSTQDQTEDVVEEKFQSSNFKDVQKLIANKLENLGVKNSSLKEGTTVQKRFLSKFKSVSKTEELPLKSSVNLVSQPQHPLSTPPQPSPPPPPMSTQPPPPTPPPAISTPPPPPTPPPAISTPPPPPPPPLPRVPSRSATTKRAPALVDFYHTLTKHEGKKDALSPSNRSNMMANNVHNSIVGEIQNRSSHLLAIKLDVDTKGEFIKYLIQQVNAAAYTNIEDVLKFADWIDRELSSLADERAVLKHFNWPERKADAIREAAIEYRTLKKLETEVSSYENDLSMPCENGLKKIAGLLDKSERSIHRLIKLRDSTMVSYRDCKIPIDWMLDSGMIRQIKQASVKLAKMYMKRVSMELQSVRSLERESTQEALLLQGVRFAYRAHQFAGGLDSETMCAFEELKQRLPMHMGGSRQLLAGVSSS